MLSILRNIMVFFGSIVLPILIIGGLIYLVINREPPKKEKNIGNIVKKEMNKVYLALEDLNPKIRDLLEKNKDYINLRNCKGILKDPENTGFFEKTELFNTKIESFLDKNRESNLIIYYNACSYNFSDKKSFLLIGTTKYILDNLLRKVNNQDYFKAYELKSNLSQKTPYLKEAYAPLDIIINN